MFSRKVLFVFSSLLIISAPAVEAFAAESHYCGRLREGWLAGNHKTTGWFVPYKAEVKSTRSRRNTGKKLYERGVERRQGRALTVKERLETSECNRTRSADTPPAGVTVRAASTLYPWQSLSRLNNPSEIVSQMPTEITTDVPFVPFFQQHSDISVKLIRSAYDGTKRTEVFWFELTNDAAPTRLTIQRGLSRMVSKTGLELSASRLFLADNSVVSYSAVGLITPIGTPLLFGIQFDGIDYQESTTYVSVPLFVTNQFAETMYFYGVPFTFN